MPKVPGSLFFEPDPNCSWGSHAVNAKPRSLATPRPPFHPLKLPTLPRPPLDQIPTQNSRTLKPSSSNIMSEIPPPPSAKPPSEHRSRSSHSAHRQKKEKDRSRHRHRSPSTSSYSSDSSSSSSSYSRHSRRDHSRDHKKHRSRSKGKSRYRDRDRHRDKRRDRHHDRHHRSRSRRSLSDSEVRMPRGAKRRSGNVTITVAMNLHEERSVLALRIF